MNSAKEKAMKYLRDEEILSYNIDWNNKFAESIDIAVDTTRKLCEKEKDIELKEQAKEIFQKLKYLIDEQGEGLFEEIKKEYT